MHEKSGMIKPTYFARSVFKGLTDNLMLNLYSIVLLVVVDVHTQRHHDTRQLQNVLFLWVSRLTILLLVMDVLARFDGLDTLLHPVFNQVGNFMLYLMGRLWSFAGSSMFTCRPLNGRKQPPGS